MSSKTIIICDICGQEVGYERYHMSLKYHIGNSMTLAEIDLCVTCMVNIMPHEATWAKAPRFFSL